MIFALLFACSRSIEVLFEDSFRADVFGFVVVFVDTEVVLAGELAVGVVCVFVFFGFEIANALTRSISACLGRSVWIAEMHRDGEDAVVADIVECCVDGHICRVGLWTAGEVGGALCDGDASFGHAYAFGEIPARLGDDNSSWVGVADVFGGEDR